MLDRELLDEKVIARRGRFRRSKRWWRGIHPDKGTITKGWTGWETVEEKDHIVPARTFLVRERPVIPTKKGITETLVRRIADRIDFLSESGAIEAKIRSVRENTR
jgi:hypothetical protein